MGPIGDCNDNALIEALWSRMQIELLVNRAVHADRASLRSRDW
jgi:hypothetical protein